MFSRANCRNTQATRCTIIGVTQQFGRAFDQIPHEWKTICLLDFSDGVPDLIRTLPVIESWGDAELRLGVVLSGEETWTAVIDMDTRQ